MTTIELRDRCLIIADRRMQDAVETAVKAARTGAPVLICGESGTGKELIARFIHERSARKSEPFVSVNCAAIPDGLMEAELFGYEKGAFTGAVAQRVGKFERARNGSFLLDEVSEMPLHLQAKLLRVLQEGEIERLGGQRSIPVGARIMATTNRDMGELLRSGEFRQDLFYRLHVLRVDCPPLRNRKEAIVTLAREFVRRSPHQALFDMQITLGESATEKLLSHSWPGNIRELQNVLERALVNCHGPSLEAEDLRFGAGLEEQPLTAAFGTSALESVEQKHILRAVEESGGNKAQAARTLGISVRTLRNKLKSYEA